MLINAFKSFQKNRSDYILEIYGDGPEKTKLEQYIFDNNLIDCVVLYPATKDVHSKVINAKMFVSTSDYEGLSNSMLEAMAIGLPVICTDCPCGGAKMIIDDGINGLLVPVQDEDALVAAMIRVADNEKFACEISKKGTKIREILSMRVIFEKWEQLVK